MTNYTNPATRLYRIIKNAAGHGDSHSTAEVLASALGLSYDRSKPDVHPIQTRLAALRTEADLLDAMMNSSEFSEDLYKNYLNNVRRVVSASNLDAGWGSYRQYVGADTLLSLRWCAEVIGKEPALDMAALEQVLQRIQELRQEVDALNLSLFVRNFILQQLENVEKAIHDYPIMGGSAINEGLRNIWNVYANAPGAPESADEKEEVAKLNKVISALGRIADSVIKTDKVATAAVRVAKTGQSAATALMEVMQNLPQLT